MPYSTPTPVWLLGLATHDIAGKTTLLRRMSREHRLAVLLATVLALSARATDDALELFDLVMTTELLSKAEREAAPVSAGVPQRRQARRGGEGAAGDERGGTGYQLGDGVGSDRERRHKE